MDLNAVIHVTEDAVADYKNMIDGSGLGESLGFDSFEAAFKNFVEFTLNRTLAPDVAVDFTIEVTK